MEEDFMPIKETLDEIFRFTTFKNPNNFDEYHARVLPKISKIFL